MGSFSGLIQVGAGLAEREMAKQFVTSLALGDDRCHCPRLQHMQNQKLGCVSLQLLLDCPAVTTMIGITPGDDRSIDQDGSKRRSRSVDLLYITQLLLCRTAVATVAGITPGDHTSIAPDCSECTR